MLHIQIQRKAKKFLIILVNTFQSSRESYLHDYKKMLNTIVQMEEKGLSSEQAQIEAFYAATK